MGGQINEEREREREREREIEVLLRKHSLSYLRNLKSLLTLRIFYVSRSIRERERDYIGLNGTINERVLDLQMVEKRGMSGKELRH